MRRRVAGLAALSCLLLATGCGGGDDGSTGSPRSGSSRAAGATTIDVTFRGGTVTPSGERVEVSVGKPVRLVVTADRPGEIHVHSSPEQELSYDAGTSTLTLRVDQPGVVDVESHTLEKTIVQLEVR